MILDIILLMKVMGLSLVGGGDGGGEFLGDLVKFVVEDVVVEYLVVDVVDGKHYV